MKNLLSFVVNHHVFFLFVILEFVSASLIFRGNSYQNAVFFTSSNVFIAGFYQNITSVTDYLNLKEVNEDLVQENAKLRSLITYHMPVRGTQKVYRIGKVLTPYPYKYISAKVIGNTVNQRSNYLTLDKGSMHGIKPDMGVITSDGVVGLVVKVSDNFCTVMSMLHKHTKISAKIKRNNYLGFVTWEGQNPELAKLEDIPKHLNLFIEDEIVTSSFSSIFPENIPIGRIKDYQDEQSANFYQIDLTLAADFRNLSRVYIVDNLLQGRKEER